MKKLCIFANDPLINYYEKGEIKDGYFNPQNFFEQIDFISFVEKDIEEEKIKKIVGNAKMKIHSVGKVSITKRYQHLEKISSLVKEINPNIIRAYNPRLEGWFAAKCSKKLNIPFYLSLHTQFDTNRKISMKKDFVKFLKLKFNEKVLEPYVIKHANKISIAFKIIEPYVIKHGGKNPILLYNGIDYERFHNAKVMTTLPQPLILTVGNLIPEKNHDVLIASMKNLEAFCLIIGKGPLKEKLEKIIEKLNLKEKVMIKESVPHDEIHRYYKSATVFALPFNSELEGLPMPVMEAMAAKKPVVIPYPKEGFSDDLGDSVIYVNNNSESFQKKIFELLNDKSLQKSLGEKASHESKRFDKKNIEKQEMGIYSSLMKRDNKNQNS